MKDRNVSSQRSWGGRLLRLVVYLVPLVALAVFGGVYYHKYQQLNHMSADQFTQRDNDRILREISKVYSLPKDEQPSTIASVKDKDALKKQYAFFDQAENGDVVLIYEKAQLALIYRPSSKQIVKVGPLNIQNGPKISIIGTQTDRQTVEKLLSDNKITASDGGDAKGTYASTLVVDLTGKNADAAKSLADKVKGQVGSLPDGETKPANVDLLVIAGSPQINQ